MDALDLLDREHPYLLVDWDELNIQAQAGDALIKLGVYLSPELKSTAAKSEGLQNVETNAHLAKVFDRTSIEKLHWLKHCYGKTMGSKLLLQMHPHN